MNPAGGILVDPLIRGSIDVIHGDVLHGWILGSTREVRPLLLADDEPAMMIDRNIPRPDVCKKYGLPETETPGFACRLPVAAPGASLSLFAITADGIVHIVTKKMRTGICERNFTTQIAKYSDIARQKDAVGIVCWDGAHNCIGRAKTLLDIVASKRPAMLLCYLHDEFGGKIWEPLLSEAFPLIAIPWRKREEAHTLLRKHGITFDTVWICKPRYPSFMLAKMVSRASTKFVLDIDDEETAFLGCEGQTQADYDLQGAGVADFFRDRVPARTVSGPRLQQKYGGYIVRHARDQKYLKSSVDNGVEYVRFIGTVRSHKNVHGLARAIRIVAGSTGLNIQFHVHGDIEPPELRQELEASGAQVHEGTVPLSLLDNLLENTHVLISGYPYSPATESGKLITEYQVPAKISDALASGRPILVPYTRAVEDLSQIPGIHVFNESTFRHELLAALNSQTNVEMPQDFTLDGAYASFRLAENEAVPVPILHTPKYIDASAVLESSRALVLIWKQHDAGLYGRRVDQIARSYKCKFMDNKVIILEFWENFEADNNAVKSEIEDFRDEKAILEQLRDVKKAGWFQNGILHKIILHKSGKDLSQQLETFFVNEGLHFNNTTIVLFPVISALEEVWDILRPYKKIVDVVDNELGWAKDGSKRARLLEQYFWLMRNSDKVIFNNPRNRDYFVERGFVKQQNTLVIPNWYTLPENIRPQRMSIGSERLNIFYSGNMNDRIDWELLLQIAGMPNVQLHLAGAAQRVHKELDEVIAQGAIYHGILNERETLQLLNFMDAAIVAHKIDEISNYMNPIKIGMYQAEGVPVVAPYWLCADKESMYYFQDMKECKRIIGELKKREDNWIFSRQDEKEIAYMKILS